ncbi:MAG: hypothetical protein KF782_14660 [Labilithrix sp.]|nr:hypothetical protein [Labilithrix sp.]
MACCAIALASLFAGGEASAKAPPGFWEKSLRSFKAQDEKDRTKGGVVFVGSSSIRGWHLPSAFPTLQAANRGLGGAQIDDVLGFTEQLVLRREPKVVVFYAGENDLGAGATPERVLGDYRAFVGLVHARLPKTQILFISIKPSPVLRGVWHRARESNRLVEEFTASDARLRYIDVASAMLSESGKPRRELFVDDGLHMNAAGYRLWRRIVAPVVQAALAAPAAP